MIVRENYLTGHNEAQVELIALTLASIHLVLPIIVASKPLGRVTDLSVIKMIGNTCATYGKLRIL